MSTDLMTFDVLNEQMDRPFAQVGAIVGPYRGDMYEVIERVVLNPLSAHSRLHCRKVTECPQPSI